VGNKMNEIINEENNNEITNDEEIKNNEEINNEMNKDEKKEIKNLENKNLKKRFFYCLDFPKQIWFIFWSEFGERFAFYGKKKNILKQGFRAILSLYLVKYLLFSEDTATSTVHIFNFFSYCKYSL
jgi:hypothetical protein